MTIRAKLVVAIVLMMTVSAAAMLVLVRDLHVESARRAAEQALAGAAAAYAELERSEVARMGAIADVLGQHPGIRDAFASRDRERLQAMSLPIHAILQQEHGIADWNYVDSDTRRMFLRVHLPSRYDDVLERPAILRAMGRREASAGKELGKSGFALRVGKPLFLDGKLVGYVELGEDIGFFLGRMKQQTGDDLALFIHKKRIDASEWARTRGARRNGWDDLRDVVVVNATTEDPLLDDAAVSALGDAGRTLAEQTHGAAVFARAVFPVRDSSGEVVGGLLVRHDITPLDRALWWGLLRAVIFFVALSVAASLVAFLLVDRILVRRLRAMTTTMEDASVRLAGGDYNVAATVKPSSADELGQFERFFGNFLGLVANTVRPLVERSRQQRTTQITHPAQPARPAKRA